MAKLQRYLNVLNGWEKVAAAQEDNAEELPQMESYRAKLQGLLERARSLSNDHHVLTASKQEVFKNLQETFRQGQKLVDLMRTAAVERFGADSDKLVEFGVKPFRGRTRNTKTPDSPSPAPSPETTE
ncbi:MAG TPA: hypothetical protein VGX68_12055 [Thermoanaerobaculia bacterium]|jgi:hypothetical protein|nr:hypothetical protein [Thermoanaerobaculia bacterium]